MRLFERRRLYYRCGCWASGPWQTMTYHQCPPHAGKKLQEVYKDMGNGSLTPYEKGVK